jgi:hypothetical protein
MAPRVQGTDVVEPLEGPPDFLDEADGPVDGGTVFLFLPERSEELNWVQQALPGGQIREFHDASGVLEFIAYQYP